MPVRGSQGDVWRRFDESTIGDARIRICEHRVIENVLGGEAVDQAAKPFRNRKDFGEGHVPVKLPRTTNHATARVSEGQMGYPCVHILVSASRPGEICRTECCWVDPVVGGADPGRMVPIH